MGKGIARAAAALAVVALLGLAARAADLYVSPTGTPQGDGSKGKPLDVVTALSRRSLARPGDTVWLMGGTYEGAMEGNRRVPFELAVSGTAEAPIIVRPVAGEAAHLNGTVAMRSSYAHYIGLEIGDLRWGTRGHSQATALDVFEGRSAKVINCNIFGGAMGTGVWAPDMVLNVAVDEGDEWTVDKNTYIAKADAPLFGGKTFAAYREATGFDANSTLLEAERPTGTHLFIRPNQHEKGRANVAIFNWDGLDAIEVDLKDVLAEGQAYRVYNCFDIKQTIALAKPVIEGVSAGRPVSFPMKKDKLSPEFDAFLVLPGN